MTSKMQDLLTSATVYLSAFFMPTSVWIFCVGIFVFADFVTGVAASNKEGVPFTSHRARDSVIKFAVYGVAILAAQAVSMHFFPEFPALKLVSSLTAYVELKSMDENIKRLTGKSIFGEIIAIFKRKDEENERKYK